MEYISILVVLWQLALLAFAVWVFAPHFIFDSTKNRANEIKLIAPYICFISFGVTISLMSFMYPELEILPIHKVFSKVTGSPILAFLIGVSATFLLLGIQRTESVMLRSIYMCLSVILLFPSIGTDWLSAAVLAGTAGKTVSVGSIMALSADQAQQKIKRVAERELERKRRLEVARKRADGALEIENEISRKNNK